MENTLLVAIQQTDDQIKKSLSNPQIEGATPLDVSLKWTPLTLLLISDAVNLKTKNSFKQHALHVIIAEAILNATMLPVKRVVNRERPNGHPRSFPSGHATTSFLSSQILYEELKESNPALSYSGYAISFVTCLLRLYHNKHWFSDVATGALLGIFSAKLSGKLINRITQKQTKKYLKPGNLVM
jgi:membrane-associated phospholipid phosphatase